jgi:S-formylglutathione hydrolase FrmB
MGGKGAMYLACKYPQLFCSLFSQAGNSSSQLQEHLSEIKGNLRIQIFCGTQDAHHLPSLREFHQSLVQAGIDHTYLEIEDLRHDLPGMLQRYGPIWFDYHVESLKRSRALAASTQPGSERSSG